MNALISVWDKTGIEKFAKDLISLNIKIFSTGGTKKYLEDNGIMVHGIEEITGFQELLGGRVKTLHPKIFAGILAREDQMDELLKMGIEPIDIVVVNLYPFEKTEKELEKLVEMVDIGGVSLLRAGAKNFQRVTVLSDPQDFQTVIDEIRNFGNTRIETRKYLALKAFFITSRYDGIINKTFHDIFYPDKLNPGLSIHGIKFMDLRYGENPQNPAIFYSYGEKAWIPVMGESSYNNILDFDSAWRVVNEFNESAVAIIKHTNPCGAGIGKDFTEAYKKAYDSDPQSAYGGIVAFNGRVDLETSQLLRGHFYEVVVAEDFTDDALEFFKSKKKNLKVVKMLKKPEGFEIRSVSGGILYQKYVEKDPEFRVVTKREPNERERNDLLFAWKIAKHVKSNAIVLAKDLGTVGIGAGQMSRVDSVKIAIMKSEGRSKGAVLASDGFFPFPDNVEEAAKGGITAIIQPGGSKRDEDVIKVADEYNIAMVFTNVRIFKH